VIVVVGTLLSWLGGFSLLKAPEKERARQEKKAKADRAAISKATDRFYNRNDSAVCDVIRDYLRSKRVAGKVISERAASSTKWLATEPASGHVVEVTASIEIWGESLRSKIGVAIEPSDTDGTNTMRAALRKIVRAEGTLSLD
jgi:hypothetical protein